MMEEANVGHCHGNTVFVAGRDDVVVADRAAALRDVGDAALMGTQIHFTLWEGKQNVFHFSAPASRLGLGSSGAFMSDGHLFFYCNINTRTGWRPPGAPPASGRAVIVGKSPVDGVWRIYVDSSDYYNPVPDDFQVYIGSVQHSADHPYIALAFGRELYTDTGRPAVRYRLDYHADTDQFTYEEE